MRERFDFDGTLKDLFQRDLPTLLSVIACGRRVKAFLNVELPKVQERRVDLAILLDDDTILHIEIQSTNDRKIKFRLGHYYLLLKEKYGKPVKQVVLFVGKPRMAMPDRLEADGNRIIYQLLDIREFEAAAMAVSGRPADLALSLLANDGPQRLPEILQRAARLKGPARQRLLAQLLILAGLRGLEQKLQYELRNLGVVIDITKNSVLMRWQREFLAEGRAEGRVQMLRDLLEIKFGVLPKWASTRLGKATPGQLGQWTKKVLTARSLEGVLGPRYNAD